MEWSIKKDLLFASGKWLGDNNLLMLPLQKIGL
jgi:hypothetical protein